MALVVYDRVQETTATTGTGTITLGGAVAGYQSFAVVGNGNTTFYCIVNSAQWEVGIGTYTSSGTTLARTTVLSNSNGNTSPITLSGASNVFVTYPSEKSVNLDASGNVSPLGTIASGLWNGTTIGVAYGGTGVTASSGANSVVLRDANQNIAVNSVTQTLTKTTSAGGTTNLTTASSHFQVLTGTLTQTYKLPDATSLSVGSTWVFDNDSTQNLTITDNANGTIDVVAPGGYTTVVLEANGTVAGEWLRFGMIPSEVNWGTNSLALGGSTIVSGGTWQGNAIAYNYGGTGLTTFTAANYALYSTSASALTAGTLPVAAGGTGATTFTANGVLYGNSTSAVGVTAAGTTGQVLIATTSGAPSWGSVPTTAAVTSLSFGTTGLTPATATTGAITVAGTLVAANGGTGQSSYAVGDILYASTTTALSKLADVATGNALISGGVGVAPSYGKIGLTTHVSGTLPIANGGTNSTATPTAGGAVYGTGTAYAITSAGTSGQVLTSAAASAPTWTTATNANTASAIVQRDASGNFSAGTITAALSGNASTATNLSTTNANWSTNGTITAVVGQLAWKNYGNGHTIFDASNSTSPSGSAVSNTDAATPWTGTYPTLMGWNGASTYGVRVDSARLADTATNYAGLPSGTVMLFVQTAAPTGWTKSTANDNKALRVVSGTAGTGGTVAFTTAFASQAVSGTVGTTGSTTATGTNATVTGTVSTSITGVSGSVGVSGTVGNTTITTTTMPSHTHSVPYVPGGAAAYVASAYNSFFSGGTSGSTGSDGAHNHSFSGSGSFTFSSGTASSSFTGSAPAFTGAAHNHTGGTFTGTAINLAVQYIDVIVATKN